MVSAISEVHKVTSKTKLSLTVSEERLEPQKSPGTWYWKGQDRMSVGSAHAVDIDPQTLPAQSGAQAFASMAKTDAPGHH